MKNGGLFMKLEKSIRENKIVAILRKVPLNKTANYIETIYRGGIRLVEVALNSDDALLQIELIRSKYEGRIMVGAGTAITTTLVQNAMSAGAQFLLTPSAGTDVLDYCANSGIELLPGVMTPTDVATCFKFGFKTLKLFPAGDLPPTYIKSLNGPFSDANFVAVGGVNAENIAEFLKRGFIGVGIGNGLIPQEFLQNNDWDKALLHVTELVNRIVK
jgi:2-dehydro-3-deoxyphosphogluconate aldolase/(4S)-4-hydroxy-2-oxoglutarate aldolase